MKDDDESQKGREILINQVRNSLMDLSANYNTIHFVEHSSFLDLTGLQAHHTEILDGNTADSETLGSLIDEEKILTDEKLVN